MHNSSIMPTCILISVDYECVGLPYYIFNISLIFPRNLHYVPAEIKVENMYLQTEKIPSKIVTSSSIQ